MAPRILIVDDNQELLSLLSQLVQHAGYEVVSCTRGKEALERARQLPPAAALLDVLLPDVMGFQVAETLRKEFPHLPIFFMSGVFKGGRFAMDARTKYQAEHYFEKPFDGGKLIDELRKRVVPGAPAEGSAADAFEVELDVDFVEDQPQEPMELTGRIKVTGGGNLSAELKGDNLTAKPMHQSVPVAPRPPPSGPAVVTKRRSTARPAKTGVLEDNLPQLLSAFWLSKETGELGLQKGKVKKVIYFEKGVPVFALSNLLADRFGQFLVRVGKVQAHELTDAAKVAQETKRRTGDVLVERGLLRDTERLFLVGQQVKSIIYSLFGWEEGTYQMAFGDKAVAESIKLDFHPSSLIVRGVKKLYKPERMRRLLPLESRLLPSLEPAYQLHDVELEKWEAELLPKIDGTRTTAELVALTGRPEGTVLGTLCALVALGILERRA